MSHMSVSFIYLLMSHMSVSSISFTPTSSVASCFCASTLMATAGSSKDAVTDAVSERIEDRSESVEVNLISFNFGIGQSMLEETPWTQQHQKNYLSLMDTFWDEYEADVVCGCCVGSHMMGFEYAGIRFPSVTSAQNYIVAVNQLSVVVEWDRKTDVVQLAGSSVTESQLVLTALHAKHRDGTTKASAIIVWILHVSTPNTYMPLTLKTRQRLVQEAILKMEKFSDKVIDEMLAVERHEPVQILCGDFNLTPQYVNMGVAGINSGLQHTGKLWLVKSTKNGLIGDVCIVKGCSIDTFEVSWVGRIMIEGCVMIPMMLSASR